MTVGKNVEFQGESMQNLRYASFIDFFIETEIRSGSKDSLKITALFQMKILSWFSDWQYPIGLPALNIDQIVRVMQQGNYPGLRASLVSKCWFNVSIKGWRSL
jgi:hypothetical protein